MYKNLLPALLALTSLAAHASTPINETRALDANGTLEVHNVAGEIRVSAWDQPRLVITGELGEGVESLEIKGDQQSLRVEVKAPKRSGFSWWGGGKSISSTLIIQVPAGVVLRLNGVSADVSVRGHLGEHLSVDTVSGDIEVSTGAADIALSTVSGDAKLTATRPNQRIEIDTVSGDVSALNVSGEIELESVSGDQTVRATDLKQFRTELVSGSLDLSVSALAPTARMNAESVSGDLKLKLPALAPYKIDAESFSGGITSQFGDVQSEEYGPGKKLDFKAGKGSVRVDLSTMSGGITLVRSQQ